MSANSLAEMPITDRRTATLVRSSDLATPFYRIMRHGHARFILTVSPRWRMIIAHYPSLSDYLLHANHRRHWQRSSPAQQSALCSFFFALTSKSRTRRSVGQPNVFTTAPLAITHTHKSAGSFVFPLESEDG